MNTRPIGIFDSGVGGLTIYLVLKKLLASERFYYLADQKNCPYGTKTEKEIQEIALKNSLFLQKMGCKLIVVACNTATVSAIKDLRKKLTKIPFIGVVPPIKPASLASKTGRLIILSTPVTSQSQYLINLIKKYADSKTVYNLAVPGLVELIEKGLTKSLQVQKLIKRSLKKALVDRKIDVVATGCTHYPFVKKTILKLFSQPITFIEPSLAVSRQVQRMLQQKNLNNKSALKGKDKFYTTGNFEKFEKTLIKLIGRIDLF